MPIARTITSEQLKRLAHIAMNHLDFIARQEGKQFPDSDKKMRELALSIAASHSDTVTWQIKD